MIVETMNQEQNIKYLTSLLRNQEYTKLIHELRHDHEVDVALFMETLPDDETAFVFRMLPKEMSAEVFAHLESETQLRVVEAFSDEETTSMLNELFIDDAVDFIEEMPANMVNRILRLVSPAKRQLINRYLQYHEDSAGSIMTAEYTRLKKDMTVAEAIAHLRAVGEDRETIYTLYVTDEQRRLEGVTSIRALLLAKDEERIEQIMQHDVISATTDTDREEVAKLIQRYDFLSIPIVDQENRLVGIVTVDDAVDVLQDETTEDFRKMAAISPSEKPYLKTSFLELGKQRITWLLILMVSGMVNGIILQKNEAAWTTMPLLVSFIPMLTDTGGNVGSQSSTLMIRGMTLGEIKISDFFKVVMKESATSILIGAVLGVFSFLRVMIFDKDIIAATILALAMFVTIVMAAVIGGILPLIAEKLKLDPALMAAPLITTIVDAAALGIYFAIAAGLMSLV
jgi:magnesium transporter